MYFQTGLAGGAAFYQLAIDQIIDRHPIVVHPNDRLVDVLDQIELNHWQKQEMHFLPDTSPALKCLLVTDNQQLVGIVTEQMLIRRIAADYSLQSTTIAEVMTPPVAVLPFYNSLALIDTIELFCQTEFLCLPVVDRQHRLVGVVTPQSLLQSLNPITLLRTISAFQHQQIEQATVIRETLDVNQQLLNIQVEQDFYVSKEQSLRNIANQFEHILANGALCVRCRDCINTEENQFSRIIENLPDAILRYDRQLCCLYANSATSQITPLTPADLVGRLCSDLDFPPALTQQWQACLQRVLDTGTMERLEFCSGDNSEKRYQARMLPERNGIGTVTSVLVIVSDVTETYQTQQSLQESQERLQIALDITGMGTWDWSPLTGQETWSPETEALYGLEPGSFDGRIESFLDRIHPDDRQMMHDFCLSALGEEVQHKEFRIVLPDGQVRWIISRGRVIQDKFGKSIRMIGIDLDITERKLAEEALRESQRQLEALMSNLPGIAYTCKNDLDWTPIFMSEGCLEVTGYSAQEMLDNPKMYHDLIHEDDLAMVWNTVQVAIQKGTAYELTYRIRTANGEEKWVWEKGSIVSEGGESILAGFITDISTSKQAEEKLKDSLQEKEVLLREIHHRVKNNLQMVSSLLNLQAGAIKNPQVVAALKESEKRVATMALIHERLFQSDNLAKIDFGEYAQNLLDSLARSYTHPQVDIQLDLALAQAELPIDVAISCGLIINELFSNAIKYAFPERQSGRIRVEFFLNEQQHCTLLIADDGIGLPEAINFQTTTSLGLRLVNALVRKLRGNLQIHRESGTAIHICFAQPAAA